MEGNTRIEVDSMVGMSNIGIRDNKGEILMVGMRVKGRDMGVLHRVDMRVSSGVNRKVSRVIMGDRVGMIIEGRVGMVDPSKVSMARIKVSMGKDRVSMGRDRVSMVGGTRDRSLRVRGDIMDIISKKRDEKVGERCGLEKEAMNMRNCISRDIFSMLSMASCCTSETHKI